MKNTQRFLPCPKCNTGISDNDMDVDDYGDWTINCACGLHYDSRVGDREKAIQRWNNRIPIVQQLKAEILPMLGDASESLRIGDLDDGERIINEITAKLSAV